MSRTSLLILALAAGCSTADRPTSTTAADSLHRCVGSVEVVPASAVLHVGDTLRLQAAACGVTTGWTWQSADTLVASIDPSTGVARAQRPGTATLSARARADSVIRGAALLTVTP